jgi:hypothetical protein
MAERNEQVLDRVRQELNKNPGLGSRELYEIAMGVDASIAENSLQQFHARYVLPIKRERAAQGEGRAREGGGQRRGKKRSPAKAEAAAAEPSPQAPARRRRRRGGGADRDQVRSIFMQFARDFATAETRGEIVQILSDVDRYVDQVVGGS